MIYVFYSNDPLHDDQGGGVEHFRGIYRALKRSGLQYKLISSRLSDQAEHDDRIEYISTGSNFLKFYMHLWVWFFKNRNNFTEHDVFHFHRNYAAWPKYIFSPNKGKGIVTYHGLTGYVAERKLGVLSKPIRFVMKYFERKSADLIDQIIFVSNRDRQQIKDSVLRENYKKTIVIPAAFDSSIFINSEPPEVALANKIIMVGRISYIKNIPLAIRAFSLLCEKHGDFTLTIAGDGEDHDYIKNLVEASPFKSNITLLGRVEHKDIPQLIKDNGIVLLTSRSEASPTVVKEAIASKRPIVSVDVGDVSEWIVEANNGFVCDSTPVSIANGLTGAAKMIKAGGYLQSVDLDNFSEEKIMNKLLEQYTS